MDRNRERGISVSGVRCNRRCDDGKGCIGLVQCGDMAPITIGEESNIQDNAVVHVDNGFPTVIGNGVTIGHGAIVHGCTVEDDCIIGMGAVLLNGARIGKNCIIGAGTLVPEGKEVPEGSVAFGNPVRVYRPVNEEDIKHIHANAAEYVEYAGEGKGEYN